MAKSKFYFLDVRGAVIEAILGIQIREFTKWTVCKETYGKISKSSVTNCLSELKHAGYITGQKKGNKYFYEIVDRNKLLKIRPRAFHGLTKNYYDIPPAVSLCLACEGTTVDIEASNLRGRPLFCTECKGEGTVDWISKITKEDDVVWF